MRVITYGDPNIIYGKSLDESMMMACNFKCNDCDEQYCDECEEEWCHYDQGCDYDYVCPENECDDCLIDYD